MNRHHHDAEERRPANKRDLFAALRGILLAPRTNVRVENKRPSKAEVEARYRLDRDDDGC